jgi:uncharacterized protein (DUF736 family)
MSKIGEFKPKYPADPLRELSGWIRTVAFEGNLSIKREGNSLRQNAPTHRVYITTEGRDPIEVGAAWLNTMTRGNRQGEEFLSGTIDDPSFATPLAFGVFQEGEDLWVASWRRRKSAL